MKKLRLVNGKLKGVKTSKSNRPIIPTLERPGLSTILSWLNTDAWYGVTEEMEIAKGKNEIPTTFGKSVEQAKRNSKMKRRYK